MNLAELITGAARGAVTLTGPDQATATVELDGAALLLATVHQDVAALMLELPPTGRLPVGLEGVDRHGTPTLVISSVLRYVLDIEDTTEPIIRLCLEERCPREALGRSRLARVCEEHLTLTVPGTLPLAGDDRIPAVAAAESRRLRLRAWESELTSAEERAERRQYRLSRMVRELTAGQVVDTIARLRPGAQITARTWRSYVARGRAPQPVRHIGRTPVWDPGDVLEWLDSRPGQGARTDLT